jgi:large subunit ribosomal protein L24
MPKVGKVVVSGINLSKKHQRARKSGEKGQILDKAMPISASNVKKVK